MQIRSSAQYLCRQIDAHSGSHSHYPQWYELFNNKPLVDALLDRLQHHCITIRIEGASLRTSAPATAPVQSSTSPASPKAK
ncbi:MAG: hypothetical protein IPH35_14590 [Rhodoferax sp.]|nr:hypothetical protein [Rhodoferax sp.]